MGRGDWSARRQCASVGCAREHALQNADFRSLRYDALQGHRGPDPYVFQFSAASVLQVDPREIHRLIVGLRRRRINRPDVASHFARLITEVIASARLREKGDVMRPESTKPFALSKTALLTESVYITANERIIFSYYQLAIPDRKTHFLTYPEQNIFTIES